MIPSLYIFHACMHNSVYARIDICMYTMLRIRRIHARARSAIYSWNPSTILRIFSCIHVAAKRLNDVITKS